MLEILKKYNHILNRKQKGRVLILLFMILISAVFETFGVGLIVPIITIIITPDVFETYPVLERIYEFFGFTSMEQLLLLALLGMAAMFIIKNVYAFFLTYLQLRFVYKNQFSLSVKMMNVYLHKPYEQYLNMTTSMIMRIVGTDVTNIFSLLMTLIQICTEGATFFFLLIFLCFIDFQMTMTMGVLLCLLMLIITKIFKPIMIRAGQDVQKYTVETNKWLIQAVSGIKELKVLGKEKHFLDNYSYYGSKNIDAMRRNGLFITVPRLLIESISLSGVLIYISITIIMGNDINDMLPQISAFALAAVRLMPCANRINNYLNQMSFFTPSLMSVADDLQGKIDKKDSDIRYQKPSDKKDRIIKIKKEIKLHNITYAYPDTNKKILDCADMQIPVGKAVAVIGASGAGKTTIIDILLGLLNLQGGEITADGKNIMQDYQGWLHHIGYIPQMIFMLDDTIKANVAFGYRNEEIDEKRVWKVLEEAQIADFVRGLPEGLESKIGERGAKISGGQRQRLGIARALYEDPEVMIFDEATSALDNETEAAIMESINHLHGKKTLVIIAHRLNTIKDCDIVYRVENGKILRER